MLIINQFNVTRECLRVFSMPPMQYDSQNWTRGKLYIPPCTFLQSKNKKMEVVVVKGGFFSENFHVFFDQFCE